jgi:hypothetical protein
MLIQGVLQKDPFSGHLFVFHGRKAELAFAQNDEEAPDTGNSVRAVRFSIVDGRTCKSSPNLRS